MKRFAVRILIHCFDFFSFLFLFLNTSLLLSIWHSTRKQVGSSYGYNSSKVLFNIKYFTQANVKGHLIYVHKGSLINSETHIDVMDQK